MDNRERRRSRDTNRTTRWDDRREERRNDRDARGRSRDKPRQSKRLRSVSPVSTRRLTHSRKSPSPREPTAKPLSDYNLHSYNEYEENALRQFAAEGLAARSQNSFDILHRPHLENTRFDTLSRPEEYVGNRYPTFEEPTRDNGNFRFDDPVSKTPVWVIPEHERSQEYANRMDDGNVDRLMEQNFSYVEETDRNPVIPDFDPENGDLSARQWLCLIDKFADKHNWTLDEKKYYMSSRLKGFARQWFISYKSDNNSWQTIKKHFIQVFPTDMEYHTQLQDMFLRRKKPDESMSSYFNDKVALLNSCGINGQKAVSCVIGGCTSDKNLKEDLYNLNFPSLDVLFEYVNKSSDLKEVNTKPSKVKAANETVCYKCKGIGHIGKNCKQKTPQPQAQSPIMHGALGNVSVDKKFYTVVKLHGRSFEAYVDYQSEQVTIKEEIARLVNLEYRKSFQIIKGFNGCTVPAIGETLTYLHAGDSSAVDVPVFILSDHIQAIPVIIGQSLMKHPRIRLFEKKDCIKFCDAKQSSTTLKKGIHS